VQDGVHLQRLLEGVLAIEDCQPDIRTSRQYGFELFGRMDLDRLEAGLGQGSADGYEFVSGERDGNGRPEHGDERLLMGSAEERALVYPHNRGVVGPTAIGTIGS
jgi:hypothetical protein